MHIATFYALFFGHIEIGCDVAFAKLSLDLLQGHVDQV